MLRSVGSKVAWVGRTASMMFGLALVPALVIGVSSAAFGKDGDFFKVGRHNVASAISTLTKRGDGPALRLMVGSGPPLTVNSNTRVNNLNADKVDGQDARALKPLLAVVRPNGTLDTPNSRGAVSAGKPGTGIYEVTFDRDVSSCPRVASVGVSLETVYAPVQGFIELQPIDGQMTTFNSTNGDDNIGVLTRNSTGNVADRGFQMAVFC